MGPHRRVASRSMKVATLKATSRVANQYLSRFLNKTAKNILNANITLQSMALPLCNIVPKTISKEGTILIKMILLQTSVM